MLQTMTLGEMIGQALGIFAVLLGFVSFQARTRKMLLMTQCAISVVFIAHYLLIGAYSGLAMNIVSLARNLTYSYQDKLRLSQKQTTGLYAVLYVLMGALAWQGWFSLMPIISLLINTYFMSKGDPQLVRKSILVSSPIMIIYDVLVASYGGILFESVIIVSSLIGVLRYRRED